ncbi:hypothetical protein ABLG96_15240 [Nakamurella sp. A5-74]|uniref:Uncharacterized protein n=1 Tax=Nakamurella sp. A5-74 TaxID=3158264 RepID=A0AAU8DKS9_9ACTN
MAEHPRSRTDAPLTFNHEQRASLLATLLGGLWGMRFHRKIDKFAAGSDAI